MAKVGDRVYAIAGEREDGTVGIFGAGVYQGETVPPEDTPGWPGELAKLKLPNPTILLDSGETVYGCECWWCPEGQEGSWLPPDRSKVIVETVAAYRARAAATAGEREHGHE